MAIKPGVGLTGGVRGVWALLGYRPCKDLKNKDHLGVRDGGTCRRITKGAVG